MDCWKVSQPNSNKFLLFTNFFFYIEIYTKKLPISTITRTFFSIYYNTPNYIDVVWTPITAVEGNYTVNEQLQPYHAILIRKTTETFGHNIYIFFNGETTTYPINLTFSDPLFVSQQILYSNGTLFDGSINFVAKNPKQSISILYPNIKIVYRPIIIFYAKFE